VVLAFFHLIKEEVWNAIEPHAEIFQKAVTRFGNNVIIPGVPVPQKAKDAGVKQWRGERLLEILLNMGNQYNMESTAAGFGWFKTETGPDGETETVVDTTPMMTIASLFTSNELKAAQGVWDAINLMWRDSRLVHIQLYGKPPNKVEGDPIIFTGSDGVTITLPGGYMPLMFDRDDLASTQATQSDMAGLEFNYQTSFAPPKLELKSLIARSNSGDKMINLDPLDVLRRHIHSTSTYIAFGPWLRDMRKVLNQPGVLEVMRRKIGDSAVKQLLGNMRALAGNEQQHLNWLDKFMINIKQKGSIFLLGFNIRGPLSVADAIPSLMADVGVANYLRELNILKNEQGVSVFNFILDKSRFMSRRLKGAWDRDAREAVQRNLDLNSFKTLEVVKRNVIDFSMGLYAYPGITYEMPAWMATFKKEFAKTGDEELSITAADIAIRKTQPSSDTRDLSQLQRNRNGFVNTMLMFTGWAFTRLNANREAWRSLQNGTMSSGRWAAFTFAQVVLTTMPFALMNALAVSLDGDDDDEFVFGTEVARGAVVDSFRGLPLVSNLVQASFDSLIAGEPDLRALRGASRSQSIGIMTNVLSRGITGVYDAVATEDPEERAEALWNIAHLVSFSTGVPVTRVFDQLTTELSKIVE